MKKLISGIGLALLLQCATYDARAYFSLTVMNNYISAQGDTKAEVAVSYWDPKDPRPFPCGPKPWGNPELTCTFMMAFYSASGEKIPSMGSSHPISNTGYKTYGEFGYGYFTEGRIRPFISFYPTNSWEPGTCVKLVMNGQPIDGYIPCVKLPPPGKATCVLQTLPGQNTNLSHNIVYSDNIDGNRVSKIFALNCSNGNPVNVQVRAFDPLSRQGEVQLRPDGSLISQLHINGRDAKTGVRIFNATGSNNLEISSTLHSIGKPEAGTFSGNAIAVVEYF